MVSQTSVDPFNAYMVQTIGIKHPSGCIIAGHISHRVLCGVAAKRAVYMSAGSHGKKYGRKYINDIRVVYKHFFHLL